MGPEKGRLVQESLVRALEVFEAGGEVEAVVQELLRGLSRAYPEHSFELQWGQQPEERVALVAPIVDARSQELGRLLARGPENASLEVPLKLAAGLAAVVATRQEERRAVFELRARSQVILDMAVDAIITIDKRGRIRSSNSATEQLFGYSQEELVGQNVSMLMPEPMRSEHDGYLERYQRTRVPRIIGIGRQVSGRHKSGRLFPAHLAVSEIFLEGEQLFTGFVRDISDVVKLETEMVRRETEYLEREATVVLEERKFLSRELHDSVSQALFGIVLGTQAALNVLDKPEKSREALDYVLSLAESGLAEMRALILELRPESLGSEGLVGSLTRQVKALTRRYRLEMELDLGAEPDLPLSLKHECYRVAMEAMNNVIKHAQATRLALSLQSEDGGMVLVVADDGVGFDLRAVPSTRVGLHSMRERVQGAGGQLEIATAPGQGTRVKATFPGLSGR